MHFQFFLASALLLAASIPLSSAISCFSSNDYEGESKIVNHMVACTAIFELEDGTASMGGLKRLPSKVNKERDCNLVETDTLGLGSQWVWFCLCSTSYCNRPYTMDAFARRGFTLEHKSSI